MDTLAVCASIYPRFVFIMLKGSNLDCMPLPTFQKPLAQSSSAFVLTAGAFLVLVLASAFGKWTFAACISLPNCVQVCLMCEQICVKADLLFRIRLTLNLLLPTDIFGEGGQFTWRKENFTDQTNDRWPCFGSNLCWKWHISAYNGHIQVNKNSPSHHTCFPRQPTQSWMARVHRVTDGSIANSKAKQKDFPDKRNNTLIL